MGTPAHLRSGDGDPSSPRVWGLGLPAQAWRLEMLVTQPGSPENPPHWASLPPCPLHLDYHRTDEGSPIKTTVPPMKPLPQTLQHPCRTAALLPPKPKDKASSPFLSPPLAGAALPALPCYPHTKASHKTPDTKQGMRCRVGCGLLSPSQAGLPALPGWRGKVACSGPQCAPGVGWGSRVGAKAHTSPKLLRRGREHRQDGVSHQQRQLRGPTDPSLAHLGLETLS